MFAKGAVRVGVWVLFSLALAGCLSKDPIPVGFAGELTGRHGELGVAARDGVQLAVDVINTILPAE